jgi:tetratricopeptide (TPR) repeat protein
MVIKTKHAGRCCAQGARIAHSTRTLSRGIWSTPLVVALGLAAACAAEPFTPRDDGEVLESLPVALVASRDELSELRQRLAADPSDAGLAVDVSERYLRLGGETGDARFYGYARAALGPWWDDDDLALVDLQRLLALDPQDVQGWIETANLYRVQGDYDEARRACDALEKFAGPFATAIARLPIMAATGQAEEAYQQLGELLSEARSQYASTVTWFLTMQAETAQALGRDDQAEAHWREALAGAPQDRYLLRAYSEFLLDRDRVAEALELAADHEDDDGLLLCAAVAARQLGKAAEAARLKAKLAARFAEVRQRGDEPLGRFEARYALLLEDDPGRALELALANWRVQKEVHDTHAALEAAVAASDAEAARPVLEFLAKHRVQHAELTPLVAALEGKR